MVGVAAETNSLARWWALIPALLLALVFLLDVTQPPDVVFSMLYVAPIVLTLGVGGPRATTIAFLVSSVATVAAAAFGVMPANPSAALTNRSLALLAQVLAAAVVIQQLELRGRVTRSDGAVGREAGAKRRHATGHLADLGALIAALPEALILFTPEGQVLEVNEAA
ncbi:MAG TPA: hypothetical protein VHB98_24120, partial [Chloroflexota bacterium]|nr:hypothetical protein [Chloroflexota bacterium]